MSKGQNGNKEAKKQKEQKEQKKQPAANTPGLRAATTPGALAVASLRGKKGPGGHPTR